MRLRMWVRSAAAACVGVLGSVAASGQNLFPDPGFEASGVTGVAHGGSRAGVLKAGARQHWLAIGGDLAVEPFATYQAKGFVKGAMGSGQGYALYAYSWNSYGWAFSGGVTISKADDWQEVTTTFVVPADKVTFHPLAMIDAADSGLYVDDVVVAQTQSAAATIAALLALPSPSVEQRQLLARYHLSKNDETAAIRLMEGADNAVKADIACLLAQRAKDPQERQRWVTAMICAECLRWPDAPLRLKELTMNMAPADLLKTCLDALQQSGGSEWAAKATASLLANPAALGTRSGGSIAAAEASLSDLQRAVVAASAALPANSPAAAAMAEVCKRLDAEAVGLAERRAALGTCRIVIGGQAVTPETHAIVIPDAPTPSERQAAAELALHWERLTGSTLPILADATAGARIPILLGRSALIAQRGVKVNYQRLGLEGIHLQTAGPALVLAGGQRGVLYAVYAFLEDELGCRWFTADCSTVPRQGTFTIKRLKRIYVPPLEYRDTDYPSCRPPEFGVRNKLNGLYSQADATWGEHIRYKGFVHTFNGLVPPETYFATHPEYFSEINGSRLGPENTQLCLTNPEVLRVATETVRRWIQESPEATIISVSQNDWHSYCQCAACTALAEKEGGQAGPLLHFVNGIANAIAAEHPDKIIDTLAYQYTRQPPKHVKPAPNVAVRLCSIECCFSHPLDACPTNRSFVADIKGWSKICKRLHIWDYVINYAHCVQPFPNLGVIRPNIEFFVRNGVTGIYEEANYFSKGGELAELRTYLMAKTLWDPSYDSTKAIREFTEAYYGPAAPALRDYLTLLQETVCADRTCHVRIYTSPADYLNHPEMLASAKALFDRAEAAVAGDAVLLHRVQVARLPLLYTEIALSRGALRYRDGKLVSDGGEGAVGAVERFATIARQEGVTHIREGEGGGLEEWLATQRGRGQAVEVLTLRSPHLEADVIPALGGRLWRLRATTTGRQVLKLFGDPDTGCVPNEGGYEEYSTTSYRGPGWMEPYTVLESGPQHVVLEAALLNGFTLRRTFRLLPDRAAITVESILTNRNAARPAAFRVHPAFQVQSTATAALWLLNADGSWRSHSLANPKDPTAEKELWLRDTVRPAGQWAIRDDAAGIAILNTFNPAEVATAYCNWNGAQGRVNLEQWSRSQDLPQGGSMTLTNTYEILSGATPWGK
jgi:hypothetical protein